MRDSYRMTLGMIQIHPSETKLMDNTSVPGHIIFIHGPSSSGKTTLARAVQQQLDLPFLIFSFDVFRDCQVLPMDQINGGTFSWPDMRPAVFKGVHQCLRALAIAGNNVLFEHIIETQAWLDELVRLLAGLDVFFVGLHCSLEELERREGQRGNRRIGEARTDLETVHSFATYDLALDSEQPAEDNARRLIAAWIRRNRPSVFDQLAA